MNCNYKTILGMRKKTPVTFVYTAFLSGSSKEESDVIFRAPANKDECHPEDVANGR